METQTTTQTSEGHLHFGHFGLIALTAIFLVGVSYMKNPDMFNLHPASLVVDPSLVPRYYAYVTPEEFQQPLVAGASTEGPGVSIINEDGSVTPVDTGEVLGMSTQDVQLSLDQISVNEISDSDAAIKAYFAQAETAESGYINNADFQTALISANQNQINNQAEKLEAIITSLQKLSVPQSLVRLQKLKIAQYQAGIGLLHNFTQADSNPLLVGQYLDQFLKSQQDMDNEMLAAQQKYGIDLGISLAGSSLNTLPQEGNQTGADETYMFDQTLTDLNAQQ